MLRQNQLSGFGANLSKYTYAEWNPDDKDAAYTLSNDNKTVTRTGASDNTSLRATLPKTTGKWYYEIYWPNGNPSDGAIALASDIAPILPTYPGAVEDSILYYQATSVPLFSPRFTGANLAALVAGGLGAVLGVAIDLDARKAWIRSNGAWMSALGGDPALGTGPDITWSASFPICIAQRLFANGLTCTLNAGQDPFTYPPPSGFNPGWYE